MTAYNFTLIDAVSPWSAGNSYIVRAYFDVSTTSGGSGLANNDTITATGIIPDNGTEILEVIVSHPELDTNSTPTGTYSVADATTNTIAFITSAPMGVNGVTTSGFILTNRINIAPTLTSGVITAGPGYRYGGSSPATVNSLTLTVNAAVATAATSGIIQLIVMYRCVGQ